MSEIAILVPMLGRPESIVPLMESIASATECPHSVLFIYSKSDVEVHDELEAAGARRIAAAWEPDSGDYARKINLGFRATDHPWVFLGASDLEFQPGWDRAALAAAAGREAGVVGTNDGAHPLVKRGGHATHSLVSRAYVEEFGSATVDGAGEVYCELYDHSWVDNELVAVAQARRRWMFARHAVVQHRHPHWGTAEMDATYEKGMRAIEQDRQLFMRRMNVLRRDLRTARQRRRSVR